MNRCVALAAIVACSKPTDRSAAVPPPPPLVPAAQTAGQPAALDPAWSCEQLPFADSTPVPEASGAGWLAIDGKLELVVVGDSGNHGAYAIVDPDTGETREQGRLPLGDTDASDDIEGVAVRDGVLYGLTSAGWMRAWRRDGGKFTLVDGPYPIGKIDPSLRKLHGTDEAPPEGDGIACEAKRSNCGHDFEGLAIVDAAHAGGPCAGFALGKADGALFCLVEHDGRFEVDATRKIPIGKPGAIADCAFSDDGSLWVAGNLFDLGRVYRVDGWQDLARARVVKVGELVVGFPEVIAVRGDIVYRMSDTGGAPSLMVKFRCKPPAR